MHKTNDTKWLVWSTERNQWWKPCSCGYTDDRKEAGRYTLEEAANICRDANRHTTSSPEETIVPE